jgi:TPR repeat protein
LALTLSSNLDALPAPVGNPRKARTTVGYSIDFGLAAIKPSTTPVAVEELKRGADNGNALAQNNLAYLYTFGLEVSQDYREAARWYASAAAQGLAAAQYNLAALCEHGLGVSRNPMVAAKW